MPLNESTLVVFHSNAYSKQLVDLVKTLGGKTCVITTNKGYDVLFGLFLNAKINIENIHFIDCVTKAVVQPTRQKNCAFISSPAALTEISIQLIKSPDHYNTVILDSLSTLLIYNNEVTVERFIRHLITSLKSKNTSLVLSVSEDDRNNPLVQKITGIVDRVKV